MESELRSNVHKLVRADNSKNTKAPATWLGIERFREETVGT